MARISRLRSAGRKGVGCRQARPIPTFVLSGAGRAGVRNPRGLPSSPHVRPDTSVLLSDPARSLRFAEHEVVLPVVVVTELEAKRHHPELGYFARQALRYLDDLRVEHGRLDAAAAGRRLGGTLRVELNHSDPVGRCRAGFRDRRQRHPHPRRGAQPGRRGRRRRAGQQGPADAGQGRLGRAAPPRSTAPSWPSTPAGPAWPNWRSSAGTSTSSTSPGTWSTAAAARDLPCHTGLVLAVGPAARARSAGSRRTSRCGWCAVTARRSACAGRSAEQRIALDLLLDPDDRHRLARRARRHRQVRAGAVRRASRR